MVFLEIPGEHLIIDLSKVIAIDLDCDDPSDKDCNISIFMIGAEECFEFPYTEKAWKQMTKALTGLTRR